VGKPNYHQQRRQKELSRKARQDQKQQRRLARSSTDDAIAPASPDDLTSAPALPQASESWGPSR